MTLGDPLCSGESWYGKTSSRGQELADDAVEVGLVGSTRRTGKPATWGSGQHKGDSFEVQKKK